MVPITATGPGWIFTTSFTVSHGDDCSVFARSALYVETGKTKPWKSCPSAAALRKIITFCGEDLRGVTGPVRLGSLTHDSEAAPKVTSL